MLSRNEMVVIADREYFMARNGNGDRSEKEDGRGTGIPKRLC